MLAGTLGGLLLSFSANLSASIIFDSTYTWNNLPASPLNLVSVRVTVSDTFQGNPRKEEWTYQVTNLGFFVPPAPGFAPVGIQVFTVRLRDVPFFSIQYMAGDFSQPPGWAVCAPPCNGPLGPATIAWSEVDRGSSLLPGQSATFDFTLASGGPRPPGIGNGPNTLIGSTGEAAQFAPGGTFGITGPVAAPGPPVPTGEPSTALLGATAVLGLALLQARLKRRLDSGF